MNVEGISSLRAEWNYQFFLADGRRLEGTLLASEDLWDDFLLVDVYLIDDPVDMSTRVTRIYKQHITSIAEF